MWCKLPTGFKTQLCICSQTFRQPGQNYFQLSVQACPAAFNFHSNHPERGISCAFSEFIKEKCSRSGRVTGLVHLQQHIFWNKTRTVFRPPNKIIIVPDVQHPICETNGFSILEWALRSILANTSSRDFNNSHKCLPITPAPLTGLDPWHWFERPSHCLAAWIFFLRGQKRRWKLRSEGGGVGGGVALVGVSAANVPLLTFTVCSLY